MANKFCMVEYMTWTVVPSNYIRHDTPFQASTETVLNGVVVEVDEEGRVLRIVPDEEIPREIEG